MNLPVGSKRWRVEEAYRIIRLMNRVFPCYHCGETDPEKLTFHHRRPEEKRGNIGRLAHHGELKRLQAEILKCSILCGECHQKFHRGVVPDPLQSCFEFE